MRSSTTQRGHFQSISSVLKPTQPRRCQPLHIFYQIQQIYVKLLNTIEFTSSVFNSLLTLCNEQVISSCPVSETVNFNFFSFFFFSFWDQNNHRNNLAVEQIQSSKLLATTDFLWSLITSLILYSGISVNQRNQVNDSGTERTSEEHEILGYQVIWHAASIPGFSG